jgi:hypothetical protein
MTLSLRANGMPVLRQQKTTEFHPDLNMRGYDTYRLLADSDEDYVAMARAVLAQNPHARLECTTARPPLAQWTGGLALVGITVDARGLQALRDPVPARVEGHSLFAIASRAALFTRPPAEAPAAFAPDERLPPHSRMPIAAVQAWLDAKCLKQEVPLPDDMVALRFEDDSVQEVCVQFYFDHWFNRKMDQLFMVRTAKVLALREQFRKLQLHSNFVRDIMVRRIEVGMDLEYYMNHQQCSAEDARYLLSTTFAETSRVDAKTVPARLCALEQEIDEWRYKPLRDLL